METDKPKDQCERLQKTELIKDRGTAYGVTAKSAAADRNCSLGYNRTH